MELKRAAEIPRHSVSGAERLAQMARFVEALPRGKLTFTRWYGAGQGCAVGLAACEPWFLAQGLRLEAEDSLKDCRPAFGQARDWAAVSAFFELASGDARALFDRSGYDGEVTPDPRRVAGKIRRHLTTSGAMALNA